MSLMLARVLRRKREIGVRRSLGATRSAIRNQFLGEAALLGAAGGDDDGVHRRLLREGEGGQGGEQEQGSGFRHRGSCEWQNSRGAAISDWLPAACQCVVGVEL